MGTRSVPLSELSPDNTEVRGFNGQVSAACGFSLPIVYHLPTGLYCALSVTRKPGPMWNTEEEIREQQQLGRVTLLPEAFELPLLGPAPSLEQQLGAAKKVKLPEGWNSAVPPTQPVLLWLKEKFQGQGFVQDAMTEVFMRYYYEPWYLVKTYGSKKTPPLEESWLFICCAGLGRVEKLLNFWGEAAKHYFDGKLYQQLPDFVAELFRPPSDRAWGRYNEIFLAEIAEMGLCAARERGLRYWLYVRYCIAMHYCPGAEPERAYQAFKMFVQPTYSGVTWERFCEEMFVIIRRAHDLRRLALLEQATLAERGALPPR